MSLRSLALASIAALAVASLGFASEASRGRTPHPYFQDGGTLSWSTSLAAAQAAAKADGKLIFIEYGREACGGCKYLCQNTLPDPAIKDRLAELCVGLAADCDQPESEVRRLMRENMGGARMLPFVAIVTRDLKWVTGFSGYRAAPALASVLDQVDRSPLLAPSAADLVRLEAFATEAEEAAAASRWTDVMAASRSAASIEGRSPLRTRIAASVAQAREWAERELASAAGSAKRTEDRATARVALKTVSAAFAGRAEQKDADSGVAAIDRLASIESLPSDRRASEREAAARSFAGTRWASLFGR